MKETNWNITTTGITANILILASFLTLIITGATQKTPLIIAAAAGLIFGASLKLESTKKLKTLIKPLSEFTGMAGAALLITAIILFSTSSIEMAFQAFEQTQAESITQLLTITILPLIGYKITLIAIFLATLGSTLLIWDGVDKKIPVKNRKTDYLFTGILIAITIASAFGTAIIEGISIISWTQTIQEILLTQSNFSGLITGLTIFFTYWVLGDAWKLLPTKEIIPRSGKETYEKLKKPEKITRWLIVPTIAIALSINEWINQPYLNLLTPLSTVIARKIYLYITIASITTIIAVKLLKTLKTDREKAKKILPYTVFGLTAYAAATSLSKYTETLLNQTPSQVRQIIKPILESIGAPSLIMAILAAASIASIGLKTTMKTLQKLGITPRGIEGTTITSTGILLTTIGYYLYQPTRPNILFIGIAASILTWEIGRESIILGKEIGRKATTNKSEIVKIAKKLIIAIIAIIIARATHLATQNTQINAQNVQNFTIFLFAVTGFVILISAQKRLD